MASEAKAVLLLASVRAALTNGVKHYNAAGDLLETDLEVLQALRSEGKVLIDAASREDRTDVPEQIRLIVSGR